MLLLLHPGYVRTDMTGGNGLINPDESARGLFALMREKGLKIQVHFYTNGSGALVGLFTWRILHVSS